MVAAAAIKASILDIARMVSLTGNREQGLTEYSFDATANRGLRRGTDAGGGQDHMAALDPAIRVKDGNQFPATYGQLPASCNVCHLVCGLLRIRRPHVHLTFEGISGTAERGRGILLGAGIGELDRPLA
jgi:hypothetical protein